MLTQWSLEIRTVVIHDATRTSKFYCVCGPSGDTFWFSGSEWELRWCVCRKFPGMSICPHGRVWTGLWGETKKETKSGCLWLMTRGAWPAASGRRERVLLWTCCVWGTQILLVGSCVMMTSGVRVQWESAGGQREARIKAADHPHLGDCMDAWWVGRKWSY